MLRVLLCQSIGPIWYASIVLECVAVCLLFRRHLARGYPAFTTMLGMGAVASASMVWIGLTGGTDAYSRAWSYFTLTYMCLHAGATVEILELQSRHARGLSRRVRVALGTGLGFTIFSVVVVSAGLIPAPIAQTFPVMLIGRHFSIACFLLVVLSTWMSHSLSLRVRPNLRRHAMILGFYFWAMSFGAAMGGLDTVTTRIIASLASVAIPLVCYLLWMWNMTETGEQPLQVLDVSPEELQSHVQSVQGYRKLVADLKGNSLIS